MIVELVLSAMPGAYPPAFLAPLPASARADAVDHCRRQAALIPSVSVPYEVRTSYAESRALAARRTDVYFLLEPEAS